MQTSLRGRSAGERCKGWPAGAGWGGVWGGPAGPRQSPVPEHWWPSHLPYPEHVHGHGFLQVPDREGFRQEEDDGQAARRGQEGPVF